MSDSVAPQHPDPELNGRWLERLLVESGVKKPNATWEMSQFALAALAALIAARAFHHKNPVERIMPSFHDDSGLMAANVLRDAVAARRDDAAEALNHWRGMDDWQRDEQVGRWEEKVERFDKALSDLDEMMPLLNVARSAPVRSTWHHHATDLARNFFIRRHAECNPGRPLGLAENGPAVAFVTAVIPYITEEKPTVSRVAEFLKTNRRKIEG